MGSFERRVKRGRIEAFAKGVAGDPVFQQAAAFSESAAQLAEGAPRVCAFDGSELEIVRAVGTSLWDGLEYQLACSRCSRRYVQFVPDEEGAS